MWNKSHLIENSDKIETIKGRCLLIMRKQFISVLTVAAMMAGTTSCVFAKDNFAAATNVNIGEPTTIHNKTIY